MKRQLITKLHATLEKLVHKETATGTEFWLARDLQEVLGYVRWSNFEKVIQKAIVACERATNDVEDHFLPVDKIDELAKPSANVRDYALTRYACYLIAQNAHSSKEAVAFAQTYFALQTRRQEIIESRLADQERVDAGGVERRGEARVVAGEHGDPGSVVAQLLHRCNAEPRHVIPPS